MATAASAGPVATTKLRPAGSCHCGKPPSCGHLRAKPIVDPAAISSSARMVNDQRNNSPAHSIGGKVWLMATRGRAATPFSMSTQLDLVAIDVTAHDGTPEFADTAVGQISPALELEDRRVGQQRQVLRYIVVGECRFDVFVGMREFDAEAVAQDVDQMALLQLLCREPRANALWHEAQLQRHGRPIDKANALEAKQRLRPAQAQHFGDLGRRSPPVEGKNLPPGIKRRT